MDPLFVGLGGVAGATSRHVLGERIDERTTDTLAVNVLGSLVLGLLLGAGVDGGTLLLLATGFCGAFTTFSTFAFETVRLVEAGENRRAAFSAFSNLAGAVLAVSVGIGLGGLVP